MKTKCINGKIILDKKSAITMANLTFKLHHIKMDVYNCPRCNFWHTSTANDPRFGIRRHREFRHNIC